MLCGEDEMGRGRKQILHLLGARFCSQRCYCVFEFALGKIVAKLFPVSCSLPHLYGFILFNNMRTGNLIKSLLRVL